MSYSEEWYKSRARKSLDEDYENTNGENHFLSKLEDDEVLLDVDKNSRPMFYEMVMNNPCLTEESKNQFINKFWNKFSNPKKIKYRKSVIGKYLFWLDKNFIGVVDNIMDVKDYISEHNNRYLIQITQRVGEKQFSKIIIRGNYEEEYNGFGTVLDTFEINTYLTNNLIPKSTDTFLSGKYVVDTGCSCTSMCNLDYSARVGFYKY